MKNLLVIGSGQCGTRIANRFHKDLDLCQDNVLLINTSTDDENIKNQVILSEGGSGRNPLYTLDTIIPFLKEKLEKSVTTAVEKIKPTEIVLINSAGGGSGSAINYYILTQILSNEQYKGIAKFLIPIFGFRHEGNPINSNGIAMMNLYSQISDKITILPIQNDKIYVNGEKSTFDVTNRRICENVCKLVDYDFFVGEPKFDGLGALDRNEFIRVTSPIGGFMSFAESEMGSFSLETSPLNSFNIKTASTMIIMFRTKDNRSVDMNIVKKIEETFPNAMKIYAESRSIYEEKIEILFNGVELPDEFKTDAEETIGKVANLKENKKTVKKNVKSSAKIGKKSLFSI